MTTDHKELCENVRRSADEVLHNSNRYIMTVNPVSILALCDAFDAQAKQIAELEGKIISITKELEEFGLAVTGESFGRSAAEARVAELERQKDEAEKHAAEVSRANFELEAQLERSGRDAERWWTFRNRDSLKEHLDAAFFIDKFGDEADAIIDAAISAGKGKRG